MDPSLPADPATILPPPTLAQMKGGSSEITSPGAGTRRSRRRVPARSQMGPPMGLPLQPINYTSIFTTPQTNTIVLNPTESAVQPNEPQTLDPALTSITQESIQHNVFLDDSKEQIDVASDADDALPASVVTSEAPPFPDLGPLSYFRQTQQPGISPESAKISMASSEKTNQELATEGETDEVLKSDNLHNQEIRMELVDPDIDGIIINLHGGPHMGRSDFCALETKVRQQGIDTSKEHTTAQPLSIVMNIADQKTHSYFNTSTDRLSHNYDSEDITPANRSITDNQLLVSGSAFDTDQDLRYLNNSPSHTLVPGASISKHVSLNTTTNRARPNHVVCHSGTLKEQSETDNASEITNPYIKKPRLSSHELVTATFNKRNIMEPPDYWAENSNLQQECDSPTKGLFHDNNMEPRYANDPTASASLLRGGITELCDSTQLLLDPCNTELDTSAGAALNTIKDSSEKSVEKESVPTVSELSEGEKTASTAYYEISKAEKPLKITAQQDAMNLDNSGILPAPTAMPIPETASPVIYDTRSVVLLTERRAKSCKAINPSRITIARDTVVPKSIGSKEGTQTGVTEASNIDEKSNSPLDLTSSIEIPHISLTESVRQDAKQLTTHVSGQAKDMVHIPYYSRRFDDDPTLFPILPSASAARILGYLDSLLGEELSASSGSHRSIPSYKQLILQAIRFRLLTACPELRNCAFDMDDNRTNLARFCRDLLASLSNPCYSSLPEKPEGAPKALEDIRRELLSSPPETVVNRCLDYEMYDHALYLAIVSGNSEVLCSALAAFEGHVYSSIDPTLSLLYAAYATKNRHMRWSSVQDSSGDSRLSHFKTGHNQSLSSAAHPATTIDFKERPQMLTMLEQGELYADAGGSRTHLDGSLVSLLRKSGPGSSIRRQYATFTAEDILHKIAFSYIHVLTKDERNDVLVSLLVYSKEASDNCYLRALLCILLGIPPIYDSYGRFCFTDLFPAGSGHMERQASHPHVNGAMSIGGKHIRSEVSSELEIFLQKLPTKNIQSVDLFTFRIHEILEYIHFRTTHIPHELFYQATKPVLLANYGFHHSYKYDLTLPFFPHLLPYKLAFAGFLRRESRTNDTLARYGLLYTTMAYSSIEQVISRVNLSGECLIRKDTVVADSKALLMKPSCLLTDPKSTPTNCLSTATLEYPLGFDYPTIVAPIECGDVFINTLRLASNYKKELRSKASISAKYIKELMLTSSEAIESVHHLQKEAYHWLDDLLCEASLRPNQRALLKDIQMLIEGIDIDCVLTSDFSSNYTPYRNSGDDLRDTSLLGDEVPIVRRQCMSSTLKGNNAKRQKSMATIDKDSHDERECSENGASTINRSVEPSLTDRGKLTTDYLFRKEPEFLFQAFVGYTGGKSKFQRCTMLQGDTSESCDSCENAQKMVEDSSLDFGVHSEFDNDSFNSEDNNLGTLEKVLLDPETSGSTNVTNPSVIQQHENYRGQNVTRSSLTPAPMQIYTENVTIPTTTLIKAEYESNSGTDHESASDSQSMQGSTFTTSVIQNPEQIYSGSAEPVVTTLVENPPGFPFITPEERHSAAPHPPLAIPPGFRGKNSEVPVFEQDMSSDEYSTSSDQDVVPSGRSPPPVIQIDPLSSLTREPPTQPLTIPQVPLNVSAITVPQFIAPNVCNTPAISEVTAPVNSTDFNAAMVPLPSPVRKNIPVLDSSDKKDCQEPIQEQSKDKHPQPLIFNLFKTLKPKESSDGVSVVDLKANSTGKMVYSKTYECWVTLDENGAEIPPPVQKEPTPPPVAAASYPQLNKELNRRTPAGRTTNRTAASRYKLVRD
ncbi:Hypothetical protein GLP15_498 [Giardia lamblia P15]|uniref:Uncharacterized protein n=1 Tax=Giardia intestinalis (strain P15) TaxID=658858 RepID=E1F6I4_GIAIA|nr:Hypothetical protein GLP15_498 [Giardia lamblia P15]